jgi:hypothetical protein
MFESIHEQAPELARLQATVTKLEQEAHEAASRVAQLQAEAEGAREDDLLREAKALNEGRRVPKAREPEVRAQIEGASRRAEVLQRRLALAQSDVARYISENAHNLMRLVREAKAQKAREVSELASPLATALHELQLPDADMRALQPHLEGPQEENTGEPQPSITVWGPQTRQTAFGERVAGMTLGQLEAIAAELSGLAARYEQGGTTIVGPTEDEGAA